MIRSCSSGGVEEDPLARPLVPQDEHVVLPRAHHDLVEPDAGVLKVGLVAESLTWREG